MFKYRREYEKHVTQLLKSHQRKCCYASHMGKCEGGIVSSHTLSVGSMLKPICRASRVYSLKGDSYAPDRNSRAKWKLSGLRDVSVFNGFCAKHDREIFSDIENRQITCTPKQLFVLAFRCLSKELFNKQNQLANHVTQAVYKSLLGEEAKYPKEQFDTIHKGVQKAVHELSREKSILDSALASERWDIIKSIVIPFAKKPCLSTTFPFAPDFDFNGRYLQNFNDTSQNLETLYISIFPSYTEGYAVFSSIHTGGIASMAFINSLLKRKDVTSSLIWLVLGQAENTALSPLWYESLNVHQKEILLEQFMANTDLFDPRVNMLQYAPVGIDDWEPTTAFSV